MSGEGFYKDGKSGRITRARYEDGEQVEFLSNQRKFLNIIPI